jgi:hypothetical protein
MEDAMSDRISEEVAVNAETRDPIDVIAGIETGDPLDQRPKSSFEIAWNLTHSS